MGASVSMQRFNIISPLCSKKHTSVFHYGNRRSQQTVQCIGCMQMIVLAICSFRWVAVQVMRCNARYLARTFYINGKARYRWSMNRYTEAAKPFYFQFSVPRTACAAPVLPKPGPPDPYYSYFWPLCLPSRLIFRPPFQQWKRKPKAMGRNWFRR